MVDIFASFFVNKNVHSVFIFKCYVPINLTIEIPYHIKEYTSILGS